MVLASLGIIGVWAASGVYTLDPGEAAVILWLGKRDRIVADPGLKWHVPVPFETLQIVNVVEDERERGVWDERCRRGPSAGSAPRAWSLGSGLV